jgi:D-3-phosphoglycerate dehydrogenase / 2-oxoglutarate reductase
MNTPTTGRVLVTTYPFGEIDHEPIELLKTEGIPFDVNPAKRRLREHELAELIGPYEALIAGTEPITRMVLERAENLRLIARVGIGLDSVALSAARARGIAVTYTPSAPSPAVAELAVGQMLALLRRTIAADREIRRGEWHRRIGRRLGLMTVGVIGVGRIGKLLIEHLQSWSPRILANDLKPDMEFSRRSGCVWTDADTICREADIISLHVPLTSRTRGMIGKRELALMKPDAILVNTARGEIIDEVALASTLRARPNFSAALDVFAEEPYSGELTTLVNCILSAHMGSATRDCRLRMELEAAQEVVRHFKGKPFVMPVPEEEYSIQAENDILPLAP